MPIAGQRVPKHIPAEANARNNTTSTVKQRLQYAFNNRITPVAMQRVVNTTIKEAMFSIWLAYIHCWATDVFSVGPPRDYISNPVVNQESAPCGGGVEYLHRDPASRKRRRKGKSQI
jgi:hypothetical protein